jgi:hypothetical protein
MLAQPDKEKTVKKMTAALRAKYFMFPSVLAALSKEGPLDPVKSRSMGTHSDLCYDHNTRGFGIPAESPGLRPGSGGLSGSLPHFALKTLKRSLF